MKGEIFNLFEDFVTENFGEEKFEEIFELVHTKLITKEAFVGPGTYPDSDFLAIVQEAVRSLGLTLEEGAFEFGRYCFPKLANKMPLYVDSHQDPKSFLLTLHDVIHVEVKKVMKDANPPEFTYEDTSPNHLAMTYKSKRKLYSFVEGLIQGVATHFDVKIKTERDVLCHEEGRCKFNLTFS